MLRSSIDPMLKQLVSDVENRVDCSYPVTFFLNGQAIAGMLVSQLDYMSNFGDSVKDGWGLADFDSQKEKIDKLKSKIQFAKSEPTKYLHLVSVKIVGIPSEKGKTFALRAKISDISGFMLGMYGV